MRNQAQNFRPLLTASIPVIMGQKKGKRRRGVANRTSINNCLRFN
jgi:hypothetical protein